MDNNISKAEFLRNCFKEMLDDGKPHRYRELLEFARQQIQGTRFDEKIQPNLFIQYVNSVIKKPDSNYERVQFGIYQKKSPQKQLEIKADTVLILFMSEILILKFLQKTAGSIRTIVVWCVVPKGE